MLVSGRVNASTKFGQLQFWPPPPKASDTHILFSDFAKIKDLLDLRIFEGFGAEVVER